VGLDAIAARLAELSQRLREGLRALPGVEVVESGDDLSAIVAFHIPGLPATRALADLSAQGLRIGTMGAIYAPLDMAARGLDAVLRAAPQTYTSESEIDTLLQAVAGLTVTA
jgi:selenocysteine lyase/cysteine desulfurase